MDKIVIDKLIKKQNNFIKKFNLGKKNLKYKLKKNGSIEINQKDKLLLKGRYQIIGTYSKVTKIFRHAWANKYLNNKLSSMSKKHQKHTNHPYLFKMPKIEGKGNINLINHLSIKDNNTLGFLEIKSRNKPTIYVLIKSFNKRSLRTKKKSYK